MSQSRIILGCFAGKEFVVACCMTERAQSPQPLFAATMMTGNASMTITIENLAVATAESSVRATSQLQGLRKIYSGAGPP